MISDHDTPTAGYFALWAAQDYLKTPRPYRGLHLFITTACNLRCLECAAGVPNIVHPEHYPLDYLQHAAECFFGIEHVTITGGEPTVHPRFREIVPRLRRWFGCRSLAFETNGCRAVEHQDLFGHFDDFLLSHYPENQPQTEWLSSLNVDGRAPGQTLHVVTARRARRPSPCRRANLVQYAYGRVYPCACVPSGHEGLGIPLTSRWREEIQSVPLPCADCCFAEEARDSDPIVAPLDGAGRSASAAAVDAADVRPAWRWPTLRDDVRIVGLELDGWMGSEATICVNPHRSMGRLFVHFESSLPPERHPLTLSFLDQRGGLVAEYLVEQQGTAIVQLDLPGFFKRPDDSRITLRCDRTHVAAGRELGIRICSARYLPAVMNRLQYEQLQQIQRLALKVAGCERELAAKEAVIRTLQHRVGTGVSSLLPRAVTDRLRRLRK